jgi:hypothetical protein
MATTEIQVTRTKDLKPEKYLDPSDQTKEFELDKIMGPSSQELHCKKRTNKKFLNVSKR